MVHPNHLTNELYGQVVDQSSSSCSSIRPTNAIQGRFHIDPLSFESISMIQPILSMESELGNDSGIKQSKTGLDTTLHINHLENDWLELATGSIRLRECETISLNQTSVVLNRAAA